MPFSNVRPDLLCQVGLVALTIFCGKPTSVQQRKLVSLWKRFSEQGRRSKRLIKRYQAQINQLNGQFGETEFRQGQIEHEIVSLEKLIENEKARLQSWATKKAGEIFQCPKCSGSGFRSVNRDLTKDKCRAAGTLSGR